MSNFDNLLDIIVGPNGRISVKLPNGNIVEIPELDALGISSDAENFHRYETNSQVGFTRGNFSLSNIVDLPPSIFPTTVENAFIALRHKPAPSFDLSLETGSAVNTGDISSVSLLGPVEHLVFENERFLINITQSDHQLHPGIVVRATYENNGQIFILTEGVGVGPLATANVLFDDLVWGAVDFDIQQITRLYGEDAIPLDFDADENNIFGNGVFEEKIDLLISDSSTSGANLEIENNALNDTSLSDFSFEISTVFANSPLTLDTDAVDSIIDDLLTNGTLINGGNYTVTSSTANDAGFSTELNAAISDGHQPGRANLIDFRSSDFNDNLFGGFGGVEFDSVQQEQDWYFDNRNSFLTNAAWGTQDLILKAEVDPLVLDLDGDGVELIAFDQSGVFFDIDNDGDIERTGWSGADDGILVHDLNGDGEINDITETLSEYYAAAPGTGAIYGSGFDALRTLDDNADGQFDSADAAWSELRVWVDANSDGVTDAGELTTLNDLGVTSISLDDTPDGVFVSGNEVRSNSTYALAAGGTGVISSINFIADPNGLQEVAEVDGTRFDFEDGASAFALDTDAGGVIDLTQINSITAIGGAGDDTLTGDDGDNWLIGSLGADQLFGGAGNDFIVSDADDIAVDQANVQGGTGFDIVQFVGLTGVAFNLGESQVEMAIGTDYADVLAIGSDWSGIVEAGQGDDIVVGGEADDVINSEEGNDVAYGYQGDDLLRGHRGEDRLIGGEGEDLLFGGLDDDTLSGGLGQDLLSGGAGDDELFGGDDYDVAEFSGSYGDYQVVLNQDGSTTVTDLRADGDGVDTLYDVEALNFSDINEVLLGTENPLPVKDQVLVEADLDGVTYRIAIADLLANDVDYQGDALSIREVFDAVGGSVSINGDEIIFISSDDFSGVPSFSYRVQDASGNNGVAVTVTGTGQVAEMSALVTLLRNELPNDPQFADQWYLSEIDALSAWEDYTGEGVTVGVFEVGPWDGETYGKIDYSHPDLQPNIDPEEIRTENPNIEPTQHATLVAGVIGAARNDIGGVGVAYDVTLTSKGITEDDLNALIEWREVDVANNSWGPSDQFLDIVELGGQSAGEALLREAIEQGRDSLGTAIVFSSGNDRADGHDTNALDLTNSRYAITVGAINAEGDLGNLQIAADPFSNPGASILVSAPGSNVTSTSRLVENDNGSTFGGDYETTQGTSFAAPIVSGVIALMLEANPELGWRDIHEILALSAKEVDDPSTIWAENGATHWNGGGLTFSRDYGYGLVDARAAVRLAETWTEQSTSANEVSGIIPLSVVGPLEDGDPQGNTISFSLGGALEIESVEMILGIDHARMGDLIVTLTSPAGTTSTLLNRPGVGDAGGDGHGAFAGEWRMMSTDFRGENVQGNWVITIRDAVTGETGDLNGITLKLFGANADGNDTYVFTDEFGDFSDSGRQTLDDVSGVDAINAAAVSTSSVIDLSADALSMISGKSLNLTAGTEIEHAFGGDGDDTITGNDQRNELYGGRGDDELIANASFVTAPSNAIFVDLPGTKNPVTLSENAEIITFADPADFFVEDTSVGFTSSGGQVVISANNRFVGFDVTEDLFDLRGLAGVASFDDLTISNGFSSNNYSEAKITTAGGGIVMLAGVDASELRCDLFIFDEVCGDRLSGGFGDDTLIGSLGADVFYGGEGNDELDGGAGTDTADYSNALSGTQVILNGREGIYQETFSSGRDRLSSIENIVGSNFDDTLRGNGGDNVIFGGDGGDNLDGVGGNDRLFGGAGNDGFRGRGGPDLFDGGEGTDLVNYSNSTGVNAFLGIGGTNSRAAAGDEFVDIESLVGSEIGDDRLYGDAQDNRLTGLGGDDTLRGYEGIDQLEGGDGDDTFIGDEGADVYKTGSGADTIVFNKAPNRDERDRITDFESGVDTLQIDASVFGGGLLAGQTAVLIANGNPSADAGVATFLYDTDNGTLRFDVDGDGAEEAVLFAYLQNVPTLDAGDFEFVA